MDILEALENATRNYVQTIKEQGYDKPEYNQPYDYHRKKAKQEIFDILINGEIKLDSEQDFLDRMKLDLTMNDGEYSKEFLSRWYVQYKTEWNKTYPDNKIERKQHKQHKSKYDEMFKDKTKEEITQLLDNLDIDKGLKSRLKKKYVG